MEADPLVAQPAAATSMSPRTAVVLRVATLVGLGGAVAYQGWMLEEQTRHLALLEATAQQLRGQMLRMSHAITTERTEVNQTLRTLRREVAILQSALEAGTKSVPPPAAVDPAGQ